MPGFANLGRAVGVSAAARQQHTSIVKSDVVHHGELIVGLRLLKRPEEIIRRRHEQGAVPHRVLFVLVQRRSGVFLRNAVEPFNEGFDTGGESPEIQGRSKHNTIRCLDFGDKVVESVLLDTGFAVAAGVTAQAALHFVFEEGDHFHRVACGLGPLRKRGNKLGGVALGAAAALDD